MDEWSTLRRERMTPLVEVAARVARDMPQICERFIQAVARQQGWTLS